MKTYIRRVSEAEGPTGKSPYITPLLRRNTSVRRSPVCRQVSPTGETRTEGNRGEGGRGDVSWGSRVAVMEAFDEGTRVDVVVGLPRVGSVVEAFPFDQVLDAAVAEAAVKDLFYGVLFDIFDEDWGGWWG